MFAPNETHELLKLHVKLDTLTKALHNLNLKAEVFVVDLDEHKTQVKEIKSLVGSKTDKKIAELFSCSRATVNQIKNNKIWKEA